MELKTDNEQVALIMAAYGMAELAMEREGQVFYEEFAERFANHFARAYKIIATAVNKPEKETPTHPVAGN